MRDLDCPTPETMRAILDAVDEALAVGRKVYLHCWGGVGRTGTVVGCHLVRHGTRPEEALALIADWRRDTPDGYRVSPETSAQREMIEQWRA